MARLSRASSETPLESNIAPPQVVSSFCVVVVVVELRTESTVASLPGMHSRHTSRGAGWSSQVVTQFDVVKYDVTDNCGPDCGGLM